MFVNQNGTTYLLYSVRHVGLNRSKKSFKIQKGQTVAVNRRTDK